MCLNADLMFLFSPRISRAFAMRVLCVLFHNRLFYYSRYSFRLTQMSDIVITVNLFYSVIFIRLLTFLLEGLLSDISKVNTFRQDCLTIITGVLLLTTVLAATYLYYIYTSVYIYIYI